MALFIYLFIYLFIFGFGHLRFFFFVSLSKLSIFFDYQNSRYFVGGRGVGIVRIGVRNFC